MTENTGKKLLVLSYCFPPLLVPRSIQIMKTVNALPVRGWKPTVYTVDPACTVNRMDQALLDAVDPAVTIVRGRSIENNFLSNVMASLSLQMPDDKLPWYWLGVKKARQIIDEGCNAVMSFGVYWTAHLFGLNLKKKTGLPWLIHFSDPWVDNPYHSYPPGIGAVNRRMERAVVKHADVVFFTSEQTRSLVMKKYPREWLAKAFVLPHSFDRRMYPAEPSQNDKLVLTHTGSFYKKRTPETLFNALRLLIDRLPEAAEQITVRHVGPLRDKYKAMIDDLNIGTMVETIKPVPYLESLRYISSADVLLLIDAPSDGPSVFLPSKLIDYLGSGNPVLGITPETGTSADLIRCVNGIVVDPLNVNGIADALERIYTAWRHDRSLQEFRYSQECIQEYDVATTTDQLVSHLNRLTFSS
jgi:glycosyltransferase involved in cell wall biosynthesis